MRNSHNRTGLYVGEVSVLCFSAELTLSLEKVGVELQNKYMIYFVMVQIILLRSHTGNTYYCGCLTIWLYK